MRVLITGAAGMLGLDVAAAAESGGHEVIALARAELDIADADAVSAAVGSAQPDVVINCAAYTNVDGAESDPDGAAAVNALGAGNVAAAAAAADAWVLHVSTDYVFDGSKTSPYVESDPTSPRSVYGATKLLGERQVAVAAPESHTIVRTAWLFGAGGPCFPATMLRLARERGALKVVDDQIGCPTFTGHLATALIEIATAPVRPVGVLHVAASGECSWYQFASEIMKRTGTQVTVSPCTTAEFPRPAERPAYSVLRSERGAPVLPDWREGLHEYLDATGEMAAGSVAELTTDHAREAPAGSAGRRSTQ